jgi:hypothetical protein
MSPSATNDVNDHKIVSDISLPNDIPESNQTAAKIPGDQLSALLRTAAMLLLSTS